MNRAILSCLVPALVLSGCDVPPTTAPTADPSVVRAQFAYKSCDPEAAFHGPPANYSITSLLGDKDGFGMGLPEGGTSVGMFDARLPDDPLFTDVWVTPSDFTYQHTFAPPAKGRIVSAELELLTLGIADGDNQVIGSDTDIRLYIDGIEVQRAFDEVDQFFFDGSTFVEQAGKVTLRVPACVLPSLVDGAANVRIEILQLGTGGYDAVAIDYSALRIDFHVPPGTLGG